MKPNTSQTREETTDEEIHHIIQLKSAGQWNWMQSQESLVTVFSFAITPSKKSAENIIRKVEAAVTGIDDTTCSEFYLDVLRILRKHITRGELRWHKNKEHTGHRRLQDFKTHKSIQTFGSHQTHSCLKGKVIYNTRICCQLHACTQFWDSSRTSRHRNTENLQQCPQYSDRHHLIGSPISLAITNIYMNSFVKKSIESSQMKPTCWLKHVDDIFDTWRHGKEKLEDCHQHLENKYLRSSRTLWSKHRTRQK